MNCQPSEPFLTRYLQEYKGISDRDLDDYVWPFDTYGSFLFLVPVGLLAEMIGYRKTIFVGLVLREMTRIILLYAPGIYWACAMQLTYAGATSINYVYYAYVYTVFQKGSYTIATSTIHCMYHVGNVFGSLLGQLLVDYAGVDKDLRILFYLSWIFTSIGFALFFVLPEQRYEPPPSLARSFRQEGFQGTIHVLRRLYRDNVVSVWSVWWIFGLLNHSVVSNYYQNQFYDIDPNGKFGYVEAFMEMFSALGAALPYVAVACGLVGFGSTGRRETFVICVVSSLSATMCMLSTKTESMWISYISNTIALSSYSALYSLACVSISIRLQGDARRYALVFTANSFVALAIATVLSQTGSSLEWDTDKFYYVAFSASCAASIIPPMLLLYYWSTSNTSSKCNDDDDMTTSILTRRGESELSVVVGNEDEEEEEEEEEENKRNEPKINDKSNAALLTRRKSSGCSV